MNVISIIGVSRGNEYSPNHVDNDAAIFNKVVEELGQLGCEVEVYARRISWSRVSKEISFLIWPVIKQQ